MHGEGNLIRHLGFLGYKLTYKQSGCVEYDFSTSNLAVDLRDGVRLCKMVRTHPVHVRKLWHLTAGVASQWRAALAAHESRCFFICHNTKTHHTPGCVCLNPCFAFGCGWMIWTTSCKDHFGTICSMVLRLASAASPIRDGIRFPFCIHVWPGCGNLRGTMKTPLAPSLSQQRS